MTIWVDFRFTERIEQHCHRRSSMGFRLWRSKSGSDSSLCRKSFLRFGNLNATGSSRFFALTIVIAMNWSGISSCEKNRQNAQRSREGVPKRSSVHAAGHRRLRRLLQIANQFRLTASRDLYAVSPASQRHRPSVQAAGRDHKSAGRQSRHRCRLATGTAGPALSTPERSSPSPRAPPRIATIRLTASANVNAR